MLIGLICYLLSFVITLINIKTWGFFAENTHLADDGVPFTLGGVEHLGGEDIFHLEAGGHWIRATWRRTSAGSIAPPTDTGSTHKVSLADDTALFFKD